MKGILKKLLTKSVKGKSNKNPFEDFVNSPNYDINYDPEKEETTLEPLNPGSAIMAGAKAGVDKMKEAYKRSKGKKAVKAIAKTAMDIATSPKTLAKPGAIPYGAAMLMAKLKGKKK